MRIEYRGNRFIGFCQKNFRKLDPIPDDVVIDPDCLNNNLAAFNQLKDWTSSSVHLLLKTMSP